MHIFTETEQYLIVFSIIGIFVGAFLWVLNSFAKDLRRRLDELNDIY